MTRKQALAHLRYAGYHNDTAKFTRLYAENRVSYETASKEWRAGQLARTRGLGCNCSECKPKTN